jgi:uncharacterized protein YoxC
MMLTQQLSSGTVIALSMGELLSVLVMLVSVIGGIIAFVRKDEKDKSRLEQIEKSHSEIEKSHSGLVKSHSDLVVQVAKLTEQIQQMLQLIPSTTQQPRSRRIHGDTS